MNFCSSLVCIEVVLCLEVISSALQKLHKCVTENTTELRNMSTHWRLRPNHTAGPEAEVAAQESALPRAAWGRVRSLAARCVWVFNPYFLFMKLSKGPHYAFSHKQLVFQCHLLKGCLFPVSHLGTFVEDHLTKSKPHFWALYSPPLLYKSVFVPVLYCFETADL